jgi:hypothetical protein
MENATAIALNTHTSSHYTTDKTLIQYHCKLDRRDNVTLCEGHDSEILRESPNYFRDELTGVAAILESCAVCEHYGEA